jgi:hypothetical protein
MTLWTPDGERPIPPRQRPDEPSAGSTPPAEDQPPRPPDAAPDAADDLQLTPEQQAQAEAMARELAEARARLLDTPVATVLTNHALGIYELAAIHLTSDAPDLAEAQLAIDGLASLVEGLGDRLGEGAPTLRDAVHQARMAYVQRAQTSSSSSD